MIASNCKTCDNSKFNSDPNLHCYMFKTPPEGYCMQHSGVKQYRETSYNKVMAIINRELNAKTA